VQAALAAWLLALARRRPVLLAVDNAHRIDDASAALLATLAAEVASQALLIVVCHKPEQLASSPAALRVLHQSGARMVLRGLKRDEVHELVKLWFGAVENSARLADWLHRVSGGNPQACTELAEHLVRHNAVRYIQGSWVLPQALSERELPTSLEQILQQRIAALPVPSRSLADALSVHRGQVSLDRCLALAEAEGVAEPFAALETLVRENVLLSAGDAYHFTHDALREALVAGIDPERRKQLHRGMGALIERGGLDSVGGLLDAGWHLLHGGEEEHGAHLLAEAGLRLTYASDEMRAAVPALRAALEVYLRMRKPDHELLRLLAPLGMAGYYVDRKLADEFGDLVLDTFERVLGVTRARRLRGLLGRTASLYLSLGVSALHFLVTPGLGGIGGLRRQIANYIACTTALTGTATVCLDPVTARRRADRLETLAALGGRDHAARLAYRFVQLLARLPEERVVEIADGCRELLERLEDPRPIPDMPSDARAFLHSGVLYALGSMEVFREGTGALECAQKLQERGFKLDETVSDQLRTLHHAMRGEVVLAEMYRARVEMHAMQAGSAWQAEVWVPSSTIIVYVLTLDTIGLKRAMEQIDRLAQEIPSLRRHAELARAEYHHLKGEHDRGFELAGPHLDGTADRSFLGRSFAVSNRARALNRLGRHAEAKAAVEPLIARLTAQDRTVVAIYGNLFRELSHAHAGLGEHAQAFELVDALLERHEPSRHPLLLGNLHATAAAIAVGAGDVPRALEHVSHMEHWFRPTGNPALIGQCERMLRQVRRLVDGGPGAGDAAPADGGSADDASAARSARSLLSHCQGPEQRAQFALDLLLNHVRGESGFLFSFEGGALSLIAPQHGEEPPPQLLSRLHSDIAGQMEDEAATVVTKAPGSASLPPPMPVVEVEQVYRSYVLTIPGRDELRIVGAVAVSVGEKPLRPAQQAFLQGVARSLFEAGDAGATTDTRTR
jgi:hypothetical protein